MICVWGLISLKVPLNHLEVWLQLITWTKKMVRLQFSIAQCVTCKKAVLTPSEKIVPCPQGLKCFHDNQLLTFQDPSQSHTIKTPGGLRSTTVCVSIFYQDKSLWSMGNRIKWSWSLLKYYLRLRRSFNFRATDSLLNIMGTFCLDKIQSENTLAELVNSPWRCCKIRYGIL